MQREETTAKDQTGSGSPAPRDPIVAEKVEQALGLMRVHGIDLWLILTDEAGHEHDPVYSLLIGERDLGGGILLLTASGRCIAITSGLDRMIPASTGVWNEVLVYDNKAVDVLKGILRELDPRRIALNFSEEDGSSDGITHGRYLQLMRALDEAGMSERVVSAEKLVASLRSVKTEHEIRAIENAIVQAGLVFEQLRLGLRPGMTGTEIFALTQAEVRARGLELGWSRYNCPVVTVGPVGFMGHTPPDGRRLERGQLLQVDLGVKHNGYCSDFQRMFYVLADGETEPPVEVRRLFALVREGIDRMVQSIGPGIRNDHPSAVGFEVIRGAGFPEPRYSAGHQLGKAVHDGGVGLINFRRPRPECVMEAGQVYTVEGLETRLEGRGWISLEENVVVTEDGRRLLTERQEELWLVR